MKLSHINNIVLYSKNWYVHTDDIVGDCKKYLALDHPDLADDIAEFTNERLHALMRQDYVEWLESITESDDYLNTDLNYLKSRIDDCVAWEDDPYLKVIYHWLSSYGSYVPDLFSGLQPPVYDKSKGICPQRRLSLIDPFGGLPKDASDADLNKAAARYFSQTKLEVLKTNFLKALKDFDINKIVDILCDFNIKYRRDKRRTARWIEKSCYGLWNRAKRYINEHPDGPYKMIRNGFLGIAIWPRKMNIDLLFIPVWESADLSEVDIAPDATVVDKNKALVAKCLEKINRKHLERVLVLERGDDAFCNYDDKPIGVKAWLDDIYDTMRTGLHSYDYVGTYGTGGMYVVLHEDAEEMNIYYCGIQGFGIHEGQLYNVDRLAFGNKE